jgi:hypothetical protein
MTALRWASPQLLKPNNLDNGRRPEGLMDAHLLQLRMIFCGLARGAIADIIPPIRSGGKPVHRTLRKWLS